MKLLLALFVKKTKPVFLLSTLVIFLMGFPLSIKAQDFMMQGWYWDYPKPGCNGYNGPSIAAEMTAKAAAQKSVGFTMMWMPPMAKASFGNCSMGYDPKDLYDYGQYTGQTGLGTGAEVQTWLTTLTTNNIYPVADVVYNHRDGGEWEDNPAVRDYIMNYPWSGCSGGATPYPVNGKVRYRLPVGGSSGQGAGNYYFKFSSASQNTGFTGKPYKLYFQTSVVGFQNLPAINEVEPNGGGDCNPGQPSQTIQLGVDILGYIDDPTTCSIDEFHLNLQSGHFNSSGDYIEIYVEQVNGGGTGIDIRPYGIWSTSANNGSGANVIQLLAVQTRTNFYSLPSNQGGMFYRNFKPNGITPTCLVGEEDYPYFFLDVEQAYDGNAGGESTRKVYDDWNKWMWTLGVRGYRMDAVKHFPAWFVGQLLNDLHAANMNPPMVVGEHFTHDANALKGWINAVYAEMNESARNAIAVRAFDFELRSALRDACDEYGNDVRTIFSKGLADRAGMSGLKAVTFVNNHDYRDASGGSSLIKNDPILAYAYILTNNQIGLPTVFYPDYYGYPAEGSPGYQNYHPSNKAPLQEKIDQLLKVHKDNIAGASGRTYLNKIGSGFNNSAGDANSYILTYQLKNRPGTLGDVVVAINFGGGRVQFRQELDGIPVGSRLTDLLGNSAHSTAIVESTGGYNNSIWIDLPGRSYTVWNVGEWGLFGDDRSWIGFNKKGTNENYRVWNNGTGNIQNTELGFFTGSDVLNLVSYDIKTWKNSGGDVTGGTFYYTIYPRGKRPTTPTFASVSLNWMENIGGEQTGDQKWGFFNQSINLLHGLNPGEFTIEFYAQVNGKNPTKSEYDSNNGNNFTAHFRYNFTRSTANGSWVETSTWLDNMVPNSTSFSAEVGHQVGLNAVVNVYDLRVKEGGFLTLGSNARLTVSNNLSVAGTATLTLQSDANGTASLKHSTPDVRATVQRHITGSADAWHLLSSPVAAQQISSGNFTAGNYSFYMYSEPHALWINYKNSTQPPTWETINGGNTFVPVRGYLVGYAEPNGTSKSFSGALNAGEQSIAILKTEGVSFSGANLIGNPYPSSIDWKAENGWTRNILQDDDPGSGSAYTMHIWNHAGNNYGTFISNGSAGTLGVSQYIPPMQGFFVKAATTGNLQMTDQVKTHEGASNWLKQQKQQAQIIKMRVFHPEHGFDEAILEMSTTSSGGAEKWMSMIETAPSLWLPASGNNYSIRFIDSGASDSHLISFKPGINGTYQLVFAFDNEQFTSLKLADLQQQTELNLLENNSYIFSASVSDEPNRFLLKLGALGISEPDRSDAFRLAVNGKSLRMANSGAEILIVEICNLNGQKLDSERIQPNSVFNKTLHFPAGVYLVRIINNETSFTRKIIIQ